MERDWERLGAALAAGRKHMDVTQVDMAARIGVTRGPIQAIERGDVSRMTPTIRAYAEAIGWDKGSVRAVLEGGDPTFVERPPETPPVGPDNPNVENVRYATGMPDRIALELQDGRVLDTDVFDLSAPGSEAKLVLIAKAGASDASDEQKRKDLLTWARIQRRVRQIVDEELSNP